MKKLILLSLLTACGSNEAQSDCANSNLANKTVVIQGVNTYFAANCTYTVPLCNESGTYRTTGENKIKIYPESTSCGDISPVTCEYEISGSQILFSCQ